MKDINDTPSADEEVTPAKKPGLMDRFNSSKPDYAKIAVVAAVAVAAGAVVYGTVRTVQHYRKLEKIRVEMLEHVQQAAKDGKIEVLYDLPREEILINPEYAVALAYINDLISDEEADKAYTYIDHVKENSYANAIAMNDLLNGMIAGNPLAVVPVENGYNVRTTSMEEAQLEAQQNSSTFYKKYL